MDGGNYDEYGGGEEQNYGDVNEAVDGGNYDEYGGGEEQNYGDVNEAVDGGNYDEYGGEEEQNYGDVNEAVYEAEFLNQNKFDFHGAGDFDEDEDNGQDSEFVGLITLKLLSGSKLNPVSTLFEGKCDPYVIFSLGNQQMQTQHVPNSVDPVWGDERVLLSWDGFSVLHAQVNDYNEPPVKHEFLGEVYVDLEALQLQSDRTQSINVPLEGAMSGSLQFELTLRSG